MHAVSRIAPGMMMVFALAACVPANIQEACKREAVQTGFGKCSVEKGRQNSSGVWIVQMDCSRGLASCLNNTAGRVTVSNWTKTDDFLYANE